jgi:DNA repair exonuclease SbcCD ATPase subunit
VKLLRLYIQDFVCYQHAYIDFTQFSSALIVGKQNNDDTISNGVGKTTIFKAIEYNLFNHSDITLENIIRDEQDFCSITLDFIVDDQEYRLTRTRTRKGTTDLTLYQRTALEGETSEVLHILKNDLQYPIHNELYWKDISGRRSQDTEKEVNKLIKINIKSFRIFVHFMQTDYSGLTTSTPEKRKLLLKEAMNLAIYTKLEKIAKDKLSAFTKEADKLQLMIENLGDPLQDITELTTKLSKTEQDLIANQSKITTIESSQNLQTEIINQLTNEHSILESKFSSLLLKEQNLLSEKKSAETSVKEYTTKKANILNAARDIVAEIKTLEETQSQLSSIDFQQILTLSNQIIANKEKVAQLSLTMTNDMARIEKLKKPIPVDGECEECRQIITTEHRTFCQQKLNQELKERQLNIQNCKKEIATLNPQNISYQQEINKLMLAKQQLDSISSKIANKKLESNDKKELYEEYKGNLEKFNAEVFNKSQQLQQIAIELSSSSLEEAKILQKQITNEKQQLSILANQVFTINKELAHLNATAAVLQHDLVKRQEDKRKKIDYTKQLKELETKIAIYPNVIQAFGLSGIPNLIITNVLDDLQIEANNLLAQLKPGIQLSFFVEKTKGDGTEADTLDINYLVSGKKRYYEQLSGAQKLAATFSLKLGLSFLLQKMSGVDIKFLLLDEIDQSLDKASTDSYADIIRLFSKDFTILVITHNDRLKTRFSNAILVSQDIDLVSRAQVVSSW